MFPAVRQMGPLLESCALEKGSVVDTVAIDSDSVGVGLEGSGTAVPSRASPPFPRPKVLGWTGSSLSLLRELRWL